MPETRMAVAKALDNLRAASLDASDGTAYVCSPPWFGSGSGVLVGSPDPHAGQMIADTDTSLSEPDDHDEIDDDCNALFLAEAWNFARMILGSPDLLAALLHAGTGRDSGEAKVVATGWLAGMGRVDGEDRGPIVRFVIDASRDHAMKFANIWDGGTYEIRALPLQTGSEGHE